MDIEDTLSKSLGISSYASKLYLASNRLGFASISQIAKEAKIPRTTAYLPIKELLDQGLMSSVVIENATKYLALHPEQLPQLLKSRTRELASAVSTLLTTESIRDANNKIAVQYFIGLQGLKTAGELLLEETNEKIWYSFENALTLNEYVGHFFEREFINTRVRKRIQLKMICSIHEPENRVRALLKRDKEDLRETRIIHATPYPLPALMIVTKGLMLLATAGKHSFALIVRNAEISQTLCSVHRALWGQIRTL